MTDVVTRVGAGRDLPRPDLPLKSHERVFLERVPLPPGARGRVRPSDPWAFADLAEGVEAWGFRFSQEHGELLDRATLARRWYEEEYVPVVTLLRDAGLLAASATETDAYVKAAAERYRRQRGLGPPP